MQIPSKMDQKYKIKSHEDLQGTKSGWKSQTSPTAASQVLQDTPDLPLKAKLRALSRDKQIQGLRYDQACVQRKGVEVKDNMIYIDKNT